ncbi:hypothetical protein AKJ09_01747 [Labilithrix luteola]|uniref:Uncharacterized protein n=1 Tax=Labilithrix luteola TaxID=1391654 RepID=A0A0K1PNH9_9BACT|nr:hypothetical protein AKJ09_01747 [Labilithrix luteola]
MSNARGSSRRRGTPCKSYLKSARVQQPCTRCLVRALSSA